MANQKICLDTTALIDVLRGDPTAVEGVRRLRSDGWDLSTTSVNAFELYTGAYLTNPGKRIPQVEGVLGELKVLAFTPKEANEAGMLLASLQRSGKTVEIRDALIAGTILTNSCRTILTRNLKHFKRFKPLQVLSY